MISEKLIIRDKLFKKYKKSRLHVDKEIYKEHDIVWKISLQKRKKNFLKKNSKECIGKPKDLRKAIKSFVLPNKSDGCIAEALLENQIVKHDTKSVLKTFKVFIQTWQGIY